jgi:hypothetical protein
MHLAPATASKPVINLAELAEVNAAAPVAIRRRTPLDVLQAYLYSLAFKKPNLIEEVEAVYQHEAQRRQQATTQPRMWATR